MTTLAELTQEVVTFRDERQWQRFHSPSQLSTALAVEVGELLEVLLWRTDDEISADLQGDLRNRFEEELADVLALVLLIAHEVGTDLTDALHRKLAQNRDKYPESEYLGRHKNQ